MRSEQARILAVWFGGYVNRLQFRVLEKDLVKRRYYILGICRFKSLQRNRKDWEYFLEDTGEELERVNKQLRVKINGKNLYQELRRIVENPSYGPTGSSDDKCCHTCVYNKENHCKVKDESVTDNDWCGSWEPPPAKEEKKEERQYPIELLNAFSRRAIKHYNMINIYTALSPGPTPIRKIVIVREDKKLFCAQTGHELIKVQGKKVEYKIGGERLERLPTPRNLRSGARWPR